MQQVREHLSNDGVFVQWMSASFLDESLLRSLTATLATAFQEVRLYRPDPETLVFLASPKPLDLENGTVLPGRGINQRGGPACGARARCAGSAGARRRFAAHHERS